MPYEVYGEDFVDDGTYICSKCTHVCANIDCQKTFYSVEDRPICDDCQARIDNPIIDTHIDTYQDFDVCGYCKQLVPQEDLNINGICTQCIYDMNQVGRHTCVIENCGREALWNQLYCNVHQSADKEKILH